MLLNYGHRTFRCFSVTLNQSPALEVSQSVSQSVSQAGRQAGSQADVGNFVFPRTFITRIRPLICEFRSRAIATTATLKQEKVTLIRKEKKLLLWRLWRWQQQQYNNNIYNNNDNDDNEDDNIDNNNNDIIQNNLKQKNQFTSKNYHWFISPLPVHFILARAQYERRVDKLLHMFVEEVHWMWMK